MASIDLSTNTVREARSKAQDQEECCMESCDVCFCQGEMGKDKSTGEMKL